MYAEQKCNSKMLHCYILDKSIVTSFEYWIIWISIEESCYKFINELQNLIKYLEIVFQSHNKEFVEFVEIEQNKKKCVTFNYSIKIIK